MLCRNLEQSIDVCFKSENHEKKKIDKKTENCEKQRHTEVSSDLGAPEH